MKTKVSYNQSSVNSEERLWHPVGVCKRRNNIMLCGESEEIQKLMDILDAQNTEHTVKPSDSKQDADQDADIITPDDFASEDEQSKDPESDGEGNPDPNDQCTIKHCRIGKSKKK